MQPLVEPNHHEKPMGILCSMHVGRQPARASVCQKMKAEVDAEKGNEVGKPIQRRAQVSERTHHADEGHDRGVDCYVG